MFFLEPLESTSVATYIYWNRVVWDSIIENKYTLHEAGLHIKDYTKKIQNFILWHYSYGSKYKTSFWRHAKKISKNINDKHFLEVLNFVKNKDLNVLKDFNADKHLVYSQWEPWSFKLWYDGMTNKLNE